jgi:ribonuclease HI
MNVSDLPHVRIYSDGSCLGNPGPGGWAAILIYDRNEKIIQGQDEQTTNNRMELTAAIEALHTLKMPCFIDFYTDSEYLRRGITEWIDAWRLRNWKRKGGVLANVGLWQALDAARKPHHINWHWIHGHAGFQENERVDRLARQAISN